MSGSYSSTILYTEACDCENLNSGYSFIRFSIVRNVDSVAATVSCQPHIQFMSICACAAHSTSYSCAASLMGKSASSVSAAAVRVIAPSVSSASASVLSATSTQSLNLPSSSAFSLIAKSVSAIMRRICAAGMVMPLRVSTGVPNVNSKSCFSRLPPMRVFMSMNLWTKFAI